MELYNLAREWIYPSEESIVGEEKTGARFQDIMFERSKMFAPQGSSDNTYGVGQKSLCVQNSPI